MIFYNMIQRTLRSCQFEQVSNGGAIPSITDWPVPHFYRGSLCSKVQAAVPRIKSVVIIFRRFVSMNASIDQVFLNASPTDRLPPSFLRTITDVMPTSI